MKNFNKIISTHLLLRGGVHYLTLSGLVKPVKWRFSRLCCFHQASSKCIVFVANGVWEMPINYDVSIYVDGIVGDHGVFGEIIVRLYKGHIIDNMAYLPYTKCRKELEITMDKFEVEFYTKDNGEKPAKDFILGLDVKMRAKVLGIIHVLEEKGNQLREPYSKHLEDGIFEIRGKVGTDITRVLYFFYYGKKIIMTNGFIKKTQETPKQEIRLAKSYRKDYLERVKENE